MLNKKELGIPWKVVGNGYIVNNKRTIGVCTTKEDADFIILAANNYHALVEALEKIIVDQERIAKVMRQLAVTDESRAAWDDAKSKTAIIAEAALLATHSTPDKPASGQTPVAGDNVPKPV